MAERLCPTCGTSKALGAFYRNCSECKECKRERSRRTRLLQARKLAAFERFVSVLFDLSTRTSDSEARRSTTDSNRRGVAVTGLATASGALPAARKATPEPTPKAATA